MSKSASRLGRGLSTLIPTRDSVPRPGTPSDRPRPVHDADPQQVRQISIASLSPNPHQPRSTFKDETLKELADSIRTNGLLQPVLVRATGDDHFQLVAGERRWRAAKLAGLEKIPAIVRELSDAQSFEVALIENLQREDLGPLERAAAYQHYLEAFGGTIEDLAKRLSESRANVSNYLRLLKLQPEICYMLGSGELGMGQARSIAGVGDPQRQLALAKLAARRNLSVRQVEELAREAETRAVAVPGNDEPAVEANLPSGQRQHFADIEQALSKAIGMRIRLYPGRKKNSGRIVIAYNNLEQFDRLAELLGGSVHLE